MRIAAQLDLARQKEPLAFIFNHIDFLAENGYDMLYLYLEGMVKTASTPFAVPEKSYTADEMKQVVAHAEKRNIEIVPAINVLGHAEILLSYPELAGLSEQSEAPRNEFCPSNPDVLKFLERYLTELTEIFPSPIVHIGCDEVFKFCSCPKCRERLKTATRPQIFAEHLTACARILNKLGRKVQIWDDMADFFPELLDLLPREIERVFWEYNLQVDSKLVKYGNRRRTDIVSEYKKREIPFYGAPRDVRFSNIVSITNYCRTGSPAGMLLTSWEHAHDFMFERYPLIAFAGRWWKAGPGASPEQIFAEAQQALFGISDPAFTAAVRTYTDLSRHVSQFLRNSDLKKAGFREYPEPRTWLHRATVEFVRAVLEQNSGNVQTELGKTVLRHILHELDGTLLEMDCDLAGNALMRTGQNHFSGLQKKIQAYMAFHKQEQERFRSGMPDRMTECFRQYGKNLEHVSETARNTAALLEICFMLPDDYGREEILIEAFGKEGYAPVFHGIPKPVEDGSRPYYTFLALLPEKTVSRIRITASGDNGVGISTCTILRRGEERAVPQKLLSVSGEIEHPEALLVDDTTWAMLGNRDGLASLWDAEMHNKKHIVELEFRS